MFTKPHGKKASQIIAALAISLTFAVEPALAAKTTSIELQTSAEQTLGNPMDYASYRVRALGAAFGR